MRLPIRSTIALNILVYCAANEGRLVQMREIVDAFGTSKSHLAQVVHLLAKSKLLTTLRGRSGGISLARVSSEINMGEVLRALEGDRIRLGDLPNAQHFEAILSGVWLECCVKLDAVKISDLVASASGLGDLAQ